MSRSLVLLLVVGLCASLYADGLLADAAVPTSDLDGARDPAFLNRYEGAFIVSFDDKAFDEFLLPLGPLQRDADPKRRDAHNNNWFAPVEALNLEGQVTRAVYVLPENRTPLELVRNYRDEVQALGGQVLFECKGADCGADPGRSSSGGGGDMSLAMVLRAQEQIPDAHFSTGHCAQTERIKDQRYLTAELPEQAAHLSVLAYSLQGGTYCKALAGRTIAVVDLVQARPREQKMVTVDAPEMARSIEASGSVALYGILFDFDQATLRPESATALKEVAALLASQPDLRLLVVGHTDTAGSFDYNRALSERRAKAVVAALVGDYSSDKARLFPVGVGFAAPVASNATEDGRALNRRVELVQY